jgi:hypothetical protein
MKTNLLLVAIASLSLCVGEVQAQQTTCRPGFNGAVNCNTYMPGRTQYGTRGTTLHTPSRTIYTRCIPRTYGGFHCSSY